MSEWISVDTEEPEIGASVTAYGVYFGEINGEGGLMVASGVYTGRGDVELPSDAYHAELCDITHWQPLPTPPTKLHQG